MEKKSVIKEQRLWEVLFIQFNEQLKIIINENKIILLLNFRKNKN